MRVLGSSQEKKSDRFLSVYDILELFLLFYSAKGQACWGLICISVNAIYL